MAKKHGKFMLQNNHQRLQIIRNLQQCSKFIFQPLTILCSPRTEPLRTVVVKPPKDKPDDDYGSDYGDEETE